MMRLAALLVPRYRLGVGVREVPRRLGDGVGEGWC